MHLFSNIFNIFSLKKLVEYPEDVCIVEIKEDENTKYKSFFQKLLFWRKTRTYVKDSMA